MDIQEKKGGCCGPCMLWGAGFCGKGIMHCAKATPAAVWTEKSQREGVAQTRRNSMDGGPG